MLASSLACVVTRAGIYIISKHEAWGRNNTVYFMSFTAGALISVSFVHIIPRSFQMNSRAPAFLLAGFLLLYLFNRFLNLYICHQYKAEIYAIGIVTLAGIGLHSFIDGIIYSVTFNVSIFTGVLAVSAGALVYVGASHLLPQVEKENRRYSIISMAAGVLVAVFIVMSKG